MLYVLSPPPAVFTSVIHFPFGGLASLLKGHSSQAKYTCCWIFLDFVVRDAIFLSSDRNTWLTIINPSVNGACNNSILRTSVTFGVDIRTGCSIRWGIPSRSLIICWVLCKAIVMDVLLGP